MPTSTPPLHTSSRASLANSALGTRNLLTIVALSVVALIVLIPLTYIAPAAGAAKETVWLGVAIMGAWVVPYLLPATVVRRPGSALIAALIMGIVSMFTTPTGPMAIVGNLIGGALIELPLAVMLYRKWNVWAFLSSSAFFGAFNGLGYSFLIKEAIGPVTSTAMVLVSVCSALAGGLATIGITRVLHTAGVGAGVHA